MVAYIQHQWHCRAEDGKQCLILSRMSGKQSRDCHAVLYLLSLLSLNKIKGEIIYLIGCVSFISPDV